MKRAEYEGLVRERKRCRACVGLRNPAESEIASFDSEEIGPWTRLQGDLDAKLMVIGQDWGDVCYYLANRSFDDLRNPPTRTLERLLQAAGMEVSLGAYGQGPRGVFLTNAILCLKEGGLQGRVEAVWFAHCGARILNTHRPLDAQLQDWKRVGKALGTGTRPNQAELSVPIS